MHSVIEIIKKKRNGDVLSPEEIQYMVSGYTKGTIPDYQMAAWLMAAYLKDLNEDETAALTEAMMYSGDTIDLTSIPGIKVDKHSTGGVGDKTSLVLGPLVSSFGVPVAKMSGRGLGHTGGTLDKLESIPGIKVDMSAEHFIDQVRNHQIAICSQTKSLVPADKKIYALRDVTATVDHVALIASSIMSKKLACGSDAIVIDLKIGDGAFIKNIEDAHSLATLMIKTAKRMDKSLVAVVTSMEQPLGFAIGNALEVKEAIETLQGHGPSDFEEICVHLAAEMLLMSKTFKDHESAKKACIEKLHNGSAYSKFCEMVAAQGGELAYIDEIESRIKNSYSKSFLSTASGYIHSISAMDLGLAAMKLGAGRETKEDTIDYNAGIMLHKKVGDFVNVGDTLSMLYTNDEHGFEKSATHLEDAYSFGDQPPTPSPLIITKYA